MAEEWEKLLGGMGKPTVPGPPAVQPPPGGSSLDMLLQQFPPPSKNPAPASPSPPVPQPKSSEEGFWSLAARSFGQAAMQAGQETAAGVQAAAPTAIGGSSVAQQAAQLPEPNAADEITQLNRQPISQGWTNSRWWAAKLGSGLGSSAPVATMGGVGALAGAATPIPGGALAGGALGAGGTMALQTIVPAYKAAKARGLSDDDAMDEALLQTGIAAGFGSAMGIVGPTAVTGRTITGALRRPITEALTKMGLIEPGLMVAQQQTQKAAGPGGILTPDELLEGWITGAGVGAAMHGATYAIGKTYNAATAATAPPIDPNLLRQTWEATQGGMPEPPDNSGVKLWPKQPIHPDFNDRVGAAISGHSATDLPASDWHQVMTAAHPAAANIELPGWLADNNGRISKSDLLNYVDTRGILYSSVTNGNNITTKLYEPNAPLTGASPEFMELRYVLDADRDGVLTLGLTHYRFDPTAVGNMKGDPWSVALLSALEKATVIHADRITWDAGTVTALGLNRASKQLEKLLGIPNGATRMPGWSKDTRYIDVPISVAANVRGGLSLFSRPPGTTLQEDPHGPGRAAISAFLDRAEERGRGNEWVKTPEGGQGMYLRANRGRFVDVANLDFDRRGTGAFTHYLDHIERESQARGYQGVRVENIFNDRLPAFLERRGYTPEQTYGGPPSYRKEHSRQVLGEAQRPAPNQFPVAATGVGMISPAQLMNAGGRIARVIEDFRKSMGMKVPIDVVLHQAPHAFGNLGLSTRNTTGYKIELWLPAHTETGAEGLFSTAAHEFGHIVMFHFFDRSPIEVKNAMASAFDAYRQSLPPGTTMNQLHLLRSTAIDNFYGGHWYQPDKPLLSLSPASQRYWAGFEEWFAENVSRWAASSVKPQGITEKFFASLNRKILSVLQGFEQRLPLERQLTGVNATRSGAIQPAEQMKRWLDSLMKDATPFAADIFAAAQLRSLRRNQLAFDMAGESGINAVPQTTSTGAGRGLLSRLFGANPPNPQIPGGADRFNVFYKYMISMPQVAKRNPHIEGLQRYREQSSMLHLEKNHMMNEAETTLHAWRALLPQQADAVAGLIDDYMNMIYRTPAEVTAKVRRLPTEPEFQTLVHSNRVNNSGLGVFQMVVKDFDRMLERYKMILEQDAHMIDDPIMSADKLQSIAQQIADLRKGPYFPAMRFGNYTLTVRDSADKVVHFETFESQRYQRLAHEEALRSFPTDHRVRSGYLAKDAAPMVGLPPGLIDKIGEKLSLSDTQKAALDELRFEYAPAQSFAHRFQQRKNVPGYSTDFLRAYANYMFHGANYFTRIKYADQLRDSIKNVRRESLGIDEATKRDQIANFMQKHFELMMDPRPDFATLRSLMFHWALGASPAAATLNLSQTILGTYPYLASKFGNDAKAIFAMGNASRKFSTYYKKDTIAGMTDPEMKGISEAVRQGLISETQANTLAATADGRVLSQGFGGNRAEKLFNTFSRASQFFFEMTEQTNRRVAFRAAWDLAMADPGNQHVLQMVQENKILYESLRLKGFTDQEARAFVTAKDAVESTQYVYAPYARPRFMQGPLASSVFLFHSFTQNTLFYMWNNPGAAARSLIILGAAGGLMGLPGMEDMNGILRAVAYHLFGKDFDLQDEVRKFVIDVMNGGGHVERPGDLAGDSGIRPDILLHGLSRVGYGIPAIMDMLGSIGGLGHIPFPTVDRHNNISMGNILPFQTGPLLAPQITGPGAGGQNIDSSALRQTQRASGAVFGLGFSIYKFLESLQAPNTGPTTMLGQDLKKWEMILPTAMRNASQAFRFYQEGKARNAQGAAVVKFDPSEPEHMLEILAQGMGYRPERLSAEWDRVTAEREAEAFWDLRKSYLVRSAWTAFQAGDKKTSAEVMDAIRKFNRDLPEEARGKAITGDALRQSFQQRARNQALSETGIPQQRGNVPLARSVQRLYPEATPNRRYPPQGGALGKP